MLKIPSAVCATMVLAAAVFSTTAQARDGAHFSGARGGGRAVLTSVVLASAGLALVLLALAGLGLPVPAAITAAVPIAAATMAAAIAATMAVGAMG